MSARRDVLESLLPEAASAVGSLLSVSRPRFWFYLGGPAIVGAVYGAQSMGGIADPLVIALIGYFLIPANIFLYGVNDIYDAEIDQLNPKKGEEGREQTYNEGPVIILGVIAAVLLFVPFLVVLENGALLAAAGFFALGWTYSGPPTRFKTTPLLDSVSNGLYILPAVITYVTVAGESPPLVAVTGAWLWAMGMHTFSAIPDIGPDREAGIRTTATVLGHNNTLAYCGTCWLGAAFALALVHPGLGVLFAVYPVFIGVLVALSIDIERAYWWFPAINTGAGAVLTMAGLWVILYGS